MQCLNLFSGAPCDIVGDVSYEELRATAYDDAKRGLGLQSIVERERNLLNSKLIEFDNLLCNPYTGPVNPGLASQRQFLVATQSEHSSTPQNNAPPSVSSFSQLVSLVNMGFGTRFNVETCLKIVLEWSEKGSQ
ncbi:zinc finger CCCH domain-containing protein 16-like [Pistacia vera]|uniref:zinc finger CCCH domain-containing protein 16-like n=1 Tax=Pistacia vera TaxID=55513 RepID=UPI001262EE12|nr:zinc finger CCCH domain-containing protein 16-like [Pistacia vera]